MNLAELQTGIGTWGKGVFGEPSIEGIMAHLRDEIDELDTAVYLDADGRSNYEEEAADCLILLCQLAHALNFSLADAVAVKHARNVCRKWGEPDERGVVRHVEDHGADRIAANNLVAAVRDMRCQLDWLLTDYKRAGQVYNDYTESVEERMAVIESNREKADNVFELILKHLGVDMSAAGDPPRMTAAEIATQLAERQGGD